MKNIRVLVVGAKPMPGLSLQGQLQQPELIFAFSRCRDSALQTLGQWQPDLLLLDARDNDQTLSDSIRRLRRQLRGKPVPMLLLAPTGEDDLVLDALLAGADDFVLAPCSVSTLQHKLTKLLMGRMVDSATRHHPPSPLGAIRVNSVRGLPTILSR